MRIFTLIALILIPAFCLSACNTIQGFGVDLETAGKTIQGN